MNSPLADQSFNDFALLAAMVAFSAVLVVAALWTAAYLRIDRAVQVLSRDVGGTPKTVIAVLMGAGSLGLFLAPSALLVNSWFGTAAALWIMTSLIALAAAGRTRPKAAIKANAQELRTMNKAA
jgi:hypothetical protein